MEALSSLGTFAGHLADAALVVAILTPDATQHRSIMFDAGQAAAHTQLAAWELGVGSCLATIYQPELARTLLGFPDDLHLNFAISSGFPCESDILTSAPKAGGRRSLHGTVHFDCWGHPYDHTCD